MTQSTTGIGSSAGIAAGFVLSFIALGVLWIGTPWALQWLVCVPFGLVAYWLTRSGRDGRSMLLGAAPIALLLTQFRDADDSHLASTLLACAWLLAILAGWYLAGRGKGR